MAMVHGGINYLIPQLEFDHVEFDHVEFDHVEFDHVIDDNLKTHPILCLLVENIQ